MEELYIHGGIPLQGQVRIQGSKNAVLPLMAAAVLLEEPCEFQNCPKLSDVFQMQKLLESIGCLVNRKNSCLRVDSQNVDLPHVLSGLPREAVKGMRSSVILLGGLLSRAGELWMEYPGGCVIGKRPIDLHLRSLEQMNVRFQEKSYGFHASTTGLLGADITLPYPSVGATENIVLAGVCAAGYTVIRGAAKEPEISTLCRFLNRCGADITGAGGSVITIQGVKHLKGTSFDIPGDRIVAGTYLCACMAAGGEVYLEEAPVEEMDAVLQVAGQMGAQCQPTQSGLYVQVQGRLRAPEHLKTECYPGFPTDLQSPFVSVLTMAKGTCRVEETVFENRFHIVPYLLGMGADIEQVSSRVILVRGVEKLRGYTVKAEELRGGAALVVAGLAAKGETFLENGKYIERGYENISRDLKELGARIYSV